MTGTRRRGCLLRAISALIGSLAGATLALAITDLDYLRTLPTGRLIPYAQRPENARFNLFGDPFDPQYVDLAPRNGVDDQRDRIFLRLAARWSPVMIRNADSVPRGVNDVLCLPKDVDSLGLACKCDPTLVIARLCRSTDAPSSVIADTIHLFAGSEGDASIRDVVHRYDPRRDVRAFRAPAPETTEVCYFDLPGSDEGTWCTFYTRLFSWERKHAQKPRSVLYVHPFIQQVEAPIPDGLEAGRFEVVLQYWCLYPFNDGANNHEGDWEHINVRLRGPSRSGLDEATVRQVLSESADVARTLSIYAVDYYFHHKVCTVDRSVGKVAVVARDDEHPESYVGGDNLGLDQLLATVNGKNRYSHGNYPVPGRWHGVGPLGAAEGVGGWYRRSSKPDPWDAVRYGEEDLVVLPDWERVVGLLDTDASVLRNYFWLVVPVRFGFPVSPAVLDLPLVGVDLGNLSPPGPTFNGGWNSVGACPGYDEYPAKMFVSRGVGWPTSPTDVTRNSLGYLNAAVIPLSYISPVNAALTCVQGWCEMIRPSVFHSSIPLVFPDTTIADVYGVVGGGVVGYEYGLPRMDAVMEQGLPLYRDARIGRDDVRRGGIASTERRLISNFAVYLGLPVGGRMLSVTEAGRADLQWRWRIQRKDGSTGYVLRKVARTHVVGKTEVLIGQDRAGGGVIRVGVGAGWSWLYESRLDGTWGVDSARPSNERKLVPNRVQMSLVMTVPVYKPRAGATLCPGIGFDWWRERYWFGEGPDRRRTTTKGWRCGLFLEFKERWETVWIGMREEDAKNRPVPPSVPGG